MDIHIHVDIPIHIDIDIHTHDFSSILALVLAKDEFPELQRCGGGQGRAWKLGAEDAHQERFNPPNDGARPARFFMVELGMIIGEFSQFPQYSHNFIQIGGYIYIYICESLIDMIIHLLFISTTYINGVSINGGTKNG